MSTKATSVLSEAITFLTRATLAVAEVEENARSDVARSAAEVTTYRRERDEAQRALHACQREAQTAKLELETWRVKAEQTEMLLDNQRDITEVARREAEQWKAQSHRQEEARARQEDALIQQINSWMEQYRQVETERQRLSTKLEELLVQVGQPYVSHLAPPLDTASSSTATRTSRLHHTDYSPTAVAEPDLDQNPPKGERRSDRDDGVDQRSGPRTIETSSTNRSGPAEVHLIRRVHAIVDVPVKYEDDDELGVDPVEMAPASSVPVASSSVSVTDTEESRSFERRVPRRSDVPHTVTKSGRAVHQSPWVPTDGPPGAEATYAESSLGEEANEDAGDGDYTNDQRHVRSPKKKKRVSRRSARPLVGSPDEGEDDELMIGAEENHHEVYGSRRIRDHPSGRIQPRKSVSKASGPQTAGTKRKAPSDAHLMDRTVAGGRPKRWVDV